MSELLAWSTPGVMSTRTSFGTSSGCRAARAIEVTPPRDMPTTIRAPGASRPMATATSSAIAAGSSARASPGQSE